MTDYKDCEISADGFVIPNFDFNSLDAIIPVSTPSITPYEFNTTDEFQNILDAMKKNDIQLICKHLIFFKAAVIDNSNDIPEELFHEYSVPSTLMLLIDPIKYPMLLYTSLCAAIAWTGAQARDSELFNDLNFIKFLIEITVIALSDPKFEGDRKIGNAALGFLRNLVFNSNNIRISFIKMRGIELFSSLFLEIKDQNIDNYILWTLQNSLLVEPKPPFELIKAVESVFRSSFRVYMQGVNPSEIRLAIAYAKCGPIYAISLMKNAEFELASSYFIHAPGETQIMILDMFEMLALYPDEVVATIAKEKIKWNEFISKIPQLYNYYLNKKFISVASHLFAQHYRPIYDTEIVKCLIQIFCKGEYKIKYRVKDCLKVLFDSNPNDVLETIVYNNIIGRLIILLEDNNSSTVKFSLEILHYIVKYAQEDKDIQERIFTQLDENEFGPIIEDFCCSDELHPSYSDLADLVRKEYEILSDIYDEEQRILHEKRAEEEEEDINYQQMQAPYIDYQKLSQNHQNPNFAAFQFPNFNDQNINVNNNDNKVDDNNENNNNYNVRENVDDNEEEDVWIDADYIDFIDDDY